MSILIRHADIPKYGQRIVILSDGHAYYEDFINPYVDLGEVVLVPKHGDLIDRDKLREKEFIRDGDCYAAVMSRDIRNAPTIIPAEEEE